MSMADRGTTAAEYEYLSAHGWRESGFESMGPQGGEGADEVVYSGNWVHSNVTNPNKCHYTPDEALALTETLGL